MSYKQEQLIEQLQKENEQLREKLENARRDLAESVRAEVNQQFAIKELLDKIKYLSSNLKKLTENLE